jgi:hypothetical protein
MNAKDATAMAGQAWRQPVNSIPAANQKMLGQQVAEQTIIAQADAGMPAERIAREQDATCIHLLSEATTPEGQRFAKEYDHTARILVRELQEMEAGQ